MRRLVLHSVVLVALVGCSDGDPAGTSRCEASVQGPHAIRSNERVGDVESFLDNYGLHRVENDEVICYIYRGYQKGGLSCKFK